MVIHGDVKPNRRPGCALVCVQVCDGNSDLRRMFALRRDADRPYSLRNALPIKVHHLLARLAGTQREEQRLAEFPPPSAVRPLGVRAHIHPHLDSVLIPRGSSGIENQPLIRRLDREVEIIRVMFDRETEGTVLRALPCLRIPPRSGQAHDRRSGTPSTRPAGRPRRPDRYGGDTRTTVR